MTKTKKEYRGYTLTTELELAKQLPLGQEVKTDSIFSYDGDWEEKDDTRLMENITDIGVVTKTNEIIDVVGSEEELEFLYSGEMGKKDKVTLSKLLDAGVSAGYLVKTKDGYQAI